MTRVVRALSLSPAVHQPPKGGNYFQVSVNPLPSFVPLLTMCVLKSASYCFCPARLVPSGLPPGTQGVGLTSTTSPTTVKEEASLKERISQSQGLPDGWHAVSSLPSNREACQGICWAGVGSRPAKGPAWVWAPTGLAHQWPRVGAGCMCGTTWVCGCCRPLAIRPRKLSLGATPSAGRRVTHQLAHCLHLRSDTQWHVLAILCLSGQFPHLIF